MKLNYQHKVMVAGHMGARKHYAENTMESFINAAKMGVDMIETDVHMCASGEIVIMHDPTVDRTTDSTGYIKDLTLDQLKLLNAGTPENPQRIPTLEEFLQFICDKNILINIELKDYYTGDNGDFCHKSLEETVALIEKYNMGDQCILNSFDAFNLQYAYLKYKNKYPLHGFYPYTLLKNVDINPDEYLYCACVFDTETESNFIHLQEKGIEVWLGAGIKEKQQFADGVKKGAVLFTSDDPAKAIEILSELGAR